MTADRMGKLLETRFRHARRHSDADGADRRSAGRSTVTCHASDPMRARASPAAALSQALLFMRIAPLHFTVVSLGPDQASTERMSYDIVCYITQ